MSEPRDLALICQARQQLAEARTLGDVKQVRDKAAAIKMYAKAQGESLEIQNYAAEVKLRAERRAGELLAEMEKQNGARGVGKKVESPSVIPLPPKLKDVGVTPMQSHRWQKVASVPESVFEKHITERLEEKRPITTTGALALTKPDVPQPTKRKPTGGEVWGKWICDIIRVGNDTRSAGGIDRLVASWAPGEQEEYLEILQEHRQMVDGWISYLEQKCRNKKAG